MTHREVAHDPRRSRLLLPACLGLVGVAAFVGWLIRDRSLSELSPDERYIGEIHDSLILGQLQFTLLNRRTGKRILIVNLDDNPFDGEDPVAVVWHPNSKKLAFLTMTNELPHLKTRAYQLNSQYSAPIPESDDSWVKTELYSRASNIADRKSRRAQTVIDEWYK